MNRPTFYLIIIVISFCIARCGTSTSINENEASGVIEEYLKTNPEYQTTSFTFGEIKFKGKNDQQELMKYKELEEKGFITMTLQEQKKRFLSKDSIFVYQVQLTEKAAPFVLRQSNDKATVKSATYILDDLKPVNFVKVNSNTAKATVSLKKVETDFYPFENNRNSANDFMTKTYKLKLKKDSGWEVQ
jgi:hypothetical protein